MSEHTKVNREVYSEYDCSLKNCAHDVCPTQHVDICEECSREAWEKHEAGVVIWQECLEDLALDEVDLPEPTPNQLVGGGE